MAYERQMDTIPVAVGVIDGPSVSWRPFITDFNGTIVGHVVGRDYLAVVTDETSPRGRVIAIPLDSVNPSDRSCWRELVPASDSVIRSVTPVGGTLVLNEFVDTYARMRIVGMDGKLHGQIPLPDRGAVSAPPYPIMAVSGVPRTNKYLFNFSSLTRSWTTYAYDIQAGELETLREASADLTDSVTEDCSALSSDGTAIPYRLLYRRDLDRATTVPTLIYAYGGFNVPFVPQFPGAMAAFVEAGGILVLAHLRGGAELGLHWWQDGRMRRKQNCLDDLYAIARKLFAEELTRPEQLAVVGGSNGGLLCAAAAAQQPDMWKAVVPRVPLLDLIGGCREPYGRMAIRNEFGDPADPDDVRSLAQLSPYHLISARTRYPGVYLDAGAVDRRCPPWHARKLAARMQASTTGGPVLMHVRDDVGHAGATTTATTTTRETAWLAFVMRELDLEPPAPAASAQPHAFVAARPLWTPDVDAMRRSFRDRSLKARGVLEPIHSMQDLSVHGIAARLYRPVGNERNVLLWFHGGGWSCGDLDSYDAVARSLANRAGCAVLSVAYRLAPEHAYPAGLDDCWIATKWAASRFAGIAVGGDSAGGNLSAAIALRARDRGIMLALQVLIYPMLDWRPDSPSYNAYRQRYDNFAGSPGYGSDYQDAMRYIWDLYIPDASRRTEPDASPLRAESLVGLAPSLMISAEHDILHQEGAEYAQKLRAAGVSVETHTYSGQVHGFFHLLGIMDDSKDAVDKCGDALRRAFGVA